MLVDTHCHLNFNAFDPDREEVVRRAAGAGVGCLLNPGIDLETSRASIQLAGQYPEVFAAVGIHPNDGLSWNGSTLGQLRELAQHPRVVAIGEIGLDYYWDRTPQELQRQIFRQQLELAAEVGLPVVVHIRNRSVQDCRAMETALGILLAWQAQLAAYGPGLAQRPGVLHSFSGDVAAARRAVEANFMLGITGPVTFKNAQVLQEAVAEISLNSLLVETDAPFLTPHPYRGQRNEPARVHIVADKIAQLKDLPFASVAKVTTDNAHKLFTW